MRPPGSTTYDPRKYFFQQPTLLYKDPYSTSHIHYGNTKDILCIRKVCYVSKIYTKLKLIGKVVRRKGGVIKPGRKKVVR